MDEWHEPSPGQSQPLCEFYILMLRSVVSAQAQYIRDLERRLAGDPLTHGFLLEL